jgi:FtsZ-binding cell division protein ZapB
VFTVNGDKLAGGEGLGFWYARNVGQAGPVYGGPPRWTGLAVFVDTDGTASDGASRVLASLNQGDFEWNGEKRGEGQYFGGCLARLRNTAAPVHMRLTYINKIFKVELDDGKEGGNFANCLERANTDLPPGMFFGLTAGTGDQPDLIDVLSFEVFQLKRESAGQPVQPAQSQQQAGQPMQQQSGQLERQLSQLQNHFNTVVGRMMPGDRPLMARLDHLEEHLRALSDRLSTLQDLLSTSLSRSSTVDPTALLSALRDLRDSTQTTLRDLSAKASNAEMQTDRLVKEVGRGERGGVFWWWMGFAAAQIVLLWAYQVIRKRFDDSSKKFI